jgi:hypothetical protein
MCRSPKLIAACHVLLRLLEPRHSLCALISLILIQIMSLALLFLSVYSSSRLAPVGLETAHHGLTLGYRLRFCLTQGLNGLRRSEHEIVFFNFISCMQLSKNRLVSVEGNGFLSDSQILAWGWWALLDSNQRPPPYQGGALTN